MQALVQRVTNASVTVGNKTVGEIGQGLVVLLVGRGYQYALDAVFNPRTQDVHDRFVEVVSVVPPYPLSRFNRFAVNIPDEGMTPFKPYEYRCGVSSSPSAPWHGHQDAGDV